MNGEYNEKEMREEVESLKVETGNVSVMKVEKGNVSAMKVEKGKVSVMKVEKVMISMMKVENHVMREEKKSLEDGVESATAGRGVGILLGTKGGVSGKVRKEMSSVEKAEEDGRG